MNAHVHPIFRGILNDFAAPFSKAQLQPFIVHTFRNGQVVKQRMPDIQEARAELAAIVKNFRSWKHYVRRDFDHTFYVSPITGEWSKTVSLEWLS